MAIRPPSRERNPVYTWLRVAPVANEPTISRISEKPPMMPRMNRTAKRKIRILRRRNERTLKTKTTRQSRCILPIIIDVFCFEDIIDLFDGCSKWIIEAPTANSRSSQCQDECQERSERATSTAT